jgi:protein-disulfide isomerase
MNTELESSPVSPPDPEITPVVQPSSNTITFKRSHLYAVLLPLAFVLGLSVGYLFWGRVSQAAPQAAANVPPTQQEQAADSANENQFRRYDVPVDDDPSLGPSGAPITIIEFSDYQCPYCKRWHDDVWSEIQKNYADKVRLVYRDFPLSSIHSDATSAAEAANCANEQGKFWEFHELLFGAKSGLGDDAYKKYAAELNLDSAAFDKCLSDRRYQAEVKADFDYAANLGISSTPTFFINGIPLVGAQPFEVFKQVIDKELAGEFPK